MTVFLKCCGSGLFASALLSTLLLSSLPAFYAKSVPLPGSGGSREEQPIALTSQEQAALRQGRVLISGDEGNYTARVMASGSIDTAWAVLTDYDNFSSFLPGVESSQLIDSNGNQRTFEQVNVIRIFPITHRERIVISAAETYPANITFSQLDGDLKKLQGAWYVTGAGDRVMITHQVLVEPASNRGIFFGIYKDNLQKTMAALKQEIERRSGR